MIKNILFINTGVVWRGLEKFHFKTASKLKKRGYNVFILAKVNTPFYNKCKEYNLQVNGIKKIGNATCLNPFRIYWLVKYLKKNNINAVFLAQSSHFKYGSISAKIAGVEKIIYRRAIAKPIKNKLYNKLLLKHCITDFMAISKITRDENLKYMDEKYLPNERIKLIYKGVEKEKFLNPEIKTNIRKEYKIDNNTLIAANIGSLCRQKAQQYLIKALPKILKEHENIVILMIGKGDKEEEFKSLAKELGVENKIIFTGFRNDIPSILQQIDFMVHTAIYEGGSPWIVLEAMMVGVPIVSTKAYTIPEFIIDGQNGYIAEDKDSDDIAEKMIKMIKSNERTEMGNKSADIAKNNYTFEKTLDDIERKIFKKEFKN